MNMYVHQMTKKRRYRMAERAKSQDETRQRIVEATMQLHEELGPRSTTISAIAERAGVQRLTVYRHFPDETAVFEACTSHWLELHPPPDPEDWQAIDDPWESARVALGLHCEYYSATRVMWAVSHQDASRVPALQAPMAAFSGRLEEQAKLLGRRFGLRGARAKRLATTLGHALAFPTWADLDAREITDADKIALFLCWMHGIVGE